jgi:hypothetical protein
MPFHDYFELLLFHLSTLGAQISLLIALYHLTSPLQAAITLLPRNLILLLWTTFGRGGLVLRSNWLQMAVILAGGTIATVATDDELSQTIERASGRLGASRGETWNKEHLPSAHDPSSAPRKHPSRKLVGLAFLPLLLYFVQSPSTTTSLAAACSYLPTNVRSTLCHTFTAPTSRSVDLVIAYYDEDLAAARHHIQAMRERPFVRERESRVLIYNKGPRSEEELREKMELKSSDEVIPLPNYGREGATYLKVGSSFVRFLGALVLMRSNPTAHPPPLQLFHRRPRFCSRPLVLHPSQRPRRPLARRTASLSRPRRPHLLPSAPSRLGLGRQPED